MQGLPLRFWVILVGICFPALHAAADDAMDCEQNKDIALRIRACSVLLANSSDNVQALFNRANAYGVLNDHQKAVADYSEALKLAPQETWLYLNRADNLVALGENARALGDIEKGLTLLGSADSKAMAIALNTRGRAYGNSGDLTRALADFAKALELDPAFASAYANRGFFLSASGQQDVAIADFDKSLSLDPDNPGVYLNRALAYRRKGDIQKAIADATEAIKRAPRLVDGYLTRGNAYIGLGEYDKAIADLSKALEIEPSPRRYNSRGVAFEKKGDRTNAIVDYRKALSLNPNYALARNNLKKLGESD